MTARGRAAYVSRKLSGSMAHALCPPVHFACCALFLLAASAVRGAEPSWERISSLERQSFASNSIADLAVDGDGTLWVGTDRGLLWSQNRGRTWQVADLARAVPIYTTRRIGRLRGGDDTAGLPPLSGIARQRRNRVTSLAVGRKGLWVGTLNGLCLGDLDDKDHQTWYLFRFEAGAPGPEIWSVAEYRGEVWVSARGGVYRSSNSGRSWARVGDGLPARFDAITLGREAGGIACWLAGFDAPSRYGGAPDVFVSYDNGRAWEAVRTRTASAVAGRVSARTHRLVFIGPTLWACTRHGLARSRDNGRTWRRVRHRSGLTADEVFDVVNVGRRLWAATSEGLFYSADGGETWRQDRLVRCPVRRAVGQRGMLWLATDGGLLRRTTGGDWRAYSAWYPILAIDRVEQRDREAWFVGTGGGLAVTWDQGRTWRRLTVADGLPSNRILSVAHDDGRIWVGTDGGIWSATLTLESSRSYDRSHGLHGLQVRDLHVTADRILAATDEGLGILEKDMTEWRTVASSLDWYAVCPQDETVFGAVRRADDAMSLIRLNLETEKWRPCELPGLGDSRIYQIHSLGDTIWVAADAGLYRSRDGGETWARYGSETLRASRTTRLAEGPDRELLVQTIPSDPPAQVAFMNLSRNNGRTWQVISAAVPGHATAACVSEESVIVGTRDALFVFRDYGDALRPVSQGRWGWTRIAAFAASSSRGDRLGRVSAIDPYALHGPVLWLGSAGVGALERGVPVLDCLWPAWDLRGAEPLDVSRFALFPSERIYAIAPAPEAVWFGTGRGLVRYTRTGTWSRIAPAPAGLIAAPVRALVVRDDEVWAGTDRGLCALDTMTGAWRTFRAEDSPLPDDHVTALAWDGERLWGGTMQGAFRIDAEDHWQVVLPEERIFGIAISSAREYFATDRGVFALDRDGRIRRQLHTRNCDALADNRVLAVFVVGPDLWAATQNEVRKILVDPAEPEPATLLETSSRGPEGVLVVVNESVPGSVEVGEGYAALRSIPAENICRIRCPEEETVPRSVYEEHIREPIVEHLITRGLSRRISFIVTTYGVPLKIAPGWSAGARNDADRMGASVDSELTLLAWRNPLRGPMPNPYLHREEPFDSTRFGIFLVTRLDGPTPDVAIGMARRAVKAEEARSYGQRGFVKLDLCPSEKDPLAGRFDEAILSNLSVIRRQSLLAGRITKPERTELPYFRPGACYNTFFYLGRGARGYDPEVFSWVQGGIGVCLDRLTAVTLRDPQRAWVPGAVQGQITATLGMVDDPGSEMYLSVGGLYRYLMAGFTWAEASYMCIPHLSWQAVVIGDPLYTPFR